jgi:hypothetical protein
MGKKKKRKEGTTFISSIKCYENNEHTLLAVVETPDLSIKTFLLLSAINFAASLGNSNLFAIASQVFRTCCSR